MSTQNKDIIAEHSDGEYEEEEIFVYADFQSKIPTETWDDPNLKFKIIGLETQEPLVQINSKVFKGSYEYTCGTNVFFEEDSEPNYYNPNFEKDPEKFYKFLAKSEKSLLMNRIFVEKRGENKTNADTTPTVHLTKSYHQALNQFLKPHARQPRKCEQEDEEFFQRYRFENSSQESKNEKV